MRSHCYTGWKTRHVFCFQCPRKEPWNQQDGSVGKGTWQADLLTRVCCLGPMAEGCNQLLCCLLSAYTHTPTEREGGEESPPYLYLCYLNSEELRPEVVQWAIAFVLQASVPKFESPGPTFKARHGWECCKTSPGESRRMSPSSLLTHHSSWKRLLLVQREALFPVSKAKRKISDVCPALASTCMPICRGGYTPTLMCMCQTHINTPHGTHIRRGLEWPL